MKCSEVVWISSSVENYKNSIKPAGLWCASIHAVTVSVIGSAKKDEKVAFQQYFMYTATVTA